MTNIIMLKRLYQTEQQDQVVYGCL